MRFLILALGGGLALAAASTSAQAAKGGSCPRGYHAVAITKDASPFAPRACARLGAEAQSIFCHGSKAGPYEQLSGADYKACQASLKYLARDRCERWAPPTGSPGTYCVKVPTMAKAEKGAPAYRPTPVDPRRGERPRPSTDREAPVEGCKAIGTC